MRCFVLPSVLAWCQPSQSFVAFYAHHILSRSRPGCSFWCAICFALAQCFSSFGFVVNRFLSIIAVQPSVEDSFIDSTNLSEEKKGGASTTPSTEALFGASHVVIPSNPCELCRQKLPLGIAVSRVSFLLGTTS